MNAVKKILLLGGSRFLLPVIREAKALGLHTVTCDYLPGNIAHRYSDEYHNVSITDKEATLALARELRADGVMSFACDPGVVTAAYVAEEMGLPNVGPYESVCILQDKEKFRAFLREHGFRVPWVRSFGSAAEALRAADGLQYPLMVKPVDSAGSKGVSRVDRAGDLPAALAAAADFSRSGRLLLEGYLPQQGFSSDTDCFSVNGELKFVSFNNQYFDRSAENPYTPTGYTWPSTMPLKKQAELRFELQRLLRLLNMGTSVYNIETRVGADGEAYIMEVSPRGGGNRLSEMLHLCSGQNLVRNAVKAAVGLPVEELQNPAYRGHWSIVILHADADGRFQRLEIAEEARPWVREEDLWVRPGDEVEALSGASKAIGTLVMDWPTEAERDARMADVGAWVKVVVAA